MRPSQVDPTRRTLGPGEPGNGGTMQVLRLPPRVALVLVVTLTAASCSDGSSDDDPGVVDAFKRTITVTIAGPGSGSVEVTADHEDYAAFDFTCGPAERDCSRTSGLDEQGVVELSFSATASAGSEFYGWAGECAPGTDPTRATLLMEVERDYACTATFERLAACNNPFVIQDDFTTDTGWSFTLERFAGKDTATVTAQPAGGYPGGYRWMQHLVSDGGMATYHTYDAVTYDPGAQGAIDHVNYTEDQRVIYPPTGASVGTGFFMTQGGKYYSFYRNIFEGFTNVTWARFSLLQLKPQGRGLDFSAAGGPITFGYVRYHYTLAQRWAPLVTHGIDNFRVEVCR